MINYVIRDGKKLTGAYVQELLPEHQECYVECTEEIRQCWTEYEYDEASSSLVLKAIEPPIEQMRRQKMQEIEAWLEHANTNEFPFAGKFIAFDPAGQRNIVMLSLYVLATGQLPEQFRRVWRATDGSTVAIPDVPTFNAMIEACTFTGIANINRAHDLHDAALAATTEAQLMAIIW